MALGGCCWIWIRILSLLSFISEAVRRWKRLTVNTQVYLQYKGFYKGTISLLTWMMNFLHRWENATDNRLLMLRMPNLLAVKEYE